MAVNPMDPLISEGSSDSDHICDGRPELDRRDSPRVETTLWVRQVEAGGSFEERPGNLSVGGVYFEDPYMPSGLRLEVRFRIPGRHKDARLHAEIVRLCEKPDGYGVHARFYGVPTELELAIARFLDDLALKR